MLYHRLGPQVRGIPLNIGQTAHNNERTDDFRPPRSSLSGQAPLENVRTDRPTVRSSGRRSALPAPAGRNPRQPNTLIDYHSGRDIGKRGSVGQRDGRDEGQDYVALARLKLRYASR